MRGMAKNKEEKFITKAKDQLFRAVGFDGFDQSFVDKFPYNWYRQKTWTEQQEQEFKKWFIVEYMKTFRHSKKYAQSEASWFLFSYGWKMKENTVNLSDYCMKDNSDLL